MVRWHLADGPQNPAPDMVPSKQMQAERNRF